MPLEAVIAMLRKVSPPPPRNGSVRGAFADHLHRLQRRHAVELDILPRGDVHEVRAGTPADPGDEVQLFAGDLSAGQPDAVHQLAVPLRIDAERSAERFVGRKVDFPGRQFLQRVQQTGLRFDDLIQIHHKLPSVFRMSQYSISITQKQDNPPGISGFPVNFPLFFRSGLDIRTEMSHN